MLKYPTFVNSITNLNDARYCAAMSVDTLGFCFDPSQKNYIEMHLFEAIRGWLSGVKIMAELHEIPAIEGAKVATSIKADYIFAHHSVQDYSIQTKIPVIYHIPLDDKVVVYPKEYSYIYIDSTSDLVDLKNHTEKLQIFEAMNYKIILGCGFTDYTINEIHDLYLPFGFGLYAEDAMNVGLKDYDKLGAIFEQIAL